MIVEFFIAEEIANLINKEHVLAGQRADRTILRNKSYRTLRYNIEAIQCVRNLDVDNAGAITSKRQRFAALQDRFIQKETCETGTTSISKIQQKQKSKVFE